MLVVVNQGVKPLQRALDIFSAIAVVIEHETEAGEELVCGQTGHLDRREGGFPFDCLGDFRSRTIAGASTVRVPPLDSAAQFQLAQKLVLRDELNVGTAKVFGHILFVHAIVGTSLLDDVRKQDGRPFADAEMGCDQGQFILEFFSDGCMVSIQVNPDPDAVQAGSQGHFLRAYFFYLFTHIEFDFVFLSLILEWGQILSLFFAK